MDNNTLNTFRALSIGMDSLFSNIAATQNTTGFPPYNLYRIGENKFLIELAIAGYLKEDIRITLKEGLLLIAAIQEPSNLFKGYVDPEDDRVLKYPEKTKDGETIYDLHSSISSKWFKRSFQLGEHIVVKSAEFKEGILTIQLEQIVPEEKKIKTISIK